MLEICSRCAYEKVKKQVKGIARVYIRPAIESSHVTAIKDGSWAIYVVPKGSKLKDMVGRHNWRLIVKGHPMQKHRKEFHV